MVDIVAKSVLMAWMYNNTKGSLLLVTLFHASFNTAGILLPIANTANNLSVHMVIDLLEVALVIVITAIEGPAWLSRTEQPQVQGMKETRPQTVGSAQNPF
jgi:hypothetical protein